MKHEVKINIELDQNQIPIDLGWEQDGQKHSIQAFFLNTWEKENVTASLHLWNKNFTTEQMKAFFVQSMINMVQSFERAVPIHDEESKNLIKDLYATCNYFSEKMGLISEEEAKEMLKKAKQEDSFQQDGSVDLRTLL